MKNDLVPIVGEKVKTRIGMNWRVLTIYAISYVNEFKVLTLSDENGYVVGDFFITQCKPCT